MMNTQLCSMECTQVCTDGLVGYTYGGALGHMGSTEWNGTCKPAGSIPRHRVQGH